jgi:hypothetical protein
MQRAELLGWQKAGNTHISNKNINLEVSCTIIFAN